MTDKFQPFAGTNLQCKIRELFTYATYGNGTQHHRCDH